MLEGLGGGSVLLDQKPRFCCVTSSICVSALLI
jgi:hypothetical protein